jgi:hypothetical protein
MKINDFLEAQGYNGPVEERFRKGCLYYHRKIKDTNHQLVLYYYYDTYGDLISKSFALEICFECKDGFWVKNQFYSISEEEIKNKLTELEQRLYNTVEPMNGDKLDYRGKKDANI